MRSAILKTWILGSWVCLTGCQNVRDGFIAGRVERPSRPITADESGVSVASYDSAESPFGLSEPSARSDRGGRKGNASPQVAVTSAESPVMAEETVHVIASYKAAASDRHSIVTHKRESKSSQQAAANTPRVVLANASPMSTDSPALQNAAATSTSSHVYASASPDLDAAQRILGAASKGTSAPTPVWANSNSSDQEHWFTSKFVEPVNHQENMPQQTSPDGGVLSSDGRIYEIRLVNPYTSTRTEPSTGQGEQFVKIASITTVAPENAVLVKNVSEHVVNENVLPANIAPPDAVLMNLPTALSMVGGDHPAIAFARWRVQEAYAQIDQANVMWLPGIQTGFSFHRHDGNYQASNGAIVDVNRSSFQYGLGAGATGAGTTPRPGIQAQFHLADAIFQPDIAQKTAWARGHAENAVVNRQMLDVALAYIALLDAQQQLQILEDSRVRVTGLAKLTDDFAAAGQGLQADADRMQTEVRLLESRMSTARENIDLSSARLAHALSTDSDRRIVPMDPTVVPLELVSLEMDKSSMIHSGLSSRPELKESQALVAAACDQFRRQKFAPFVPSVLLGLSAGGFGGGVGSSINNTDDRYDFDALMTWEIRNFGFGERAARRETESRVQQAMFRKVRMMDDIAREISEAYTQVMHRTERITITQRAIQSAEDSYNRNLSRIRDGQGLPLEVLQSVQALESTRRAYLDSVIAYNEAQFRLQWSLGWSVSAPEATQ